MEGCHASGEANLTRRATAFALNIREKCHLSQRSVNDIVSGVQQYQASLVDVLKNQMKKVFEKHSGSMEQLQAEAMATFDNFTDPFLRVATTYMQNRTIQELFSQVEPEEIVISHTACRVKSGNSRVLAIKKKCFYYVPLLQSLEQLFTV